MEDIDRSSDPAPPSDPGRSPPGEITHLLLAWRDGDEQALLEIVPLVYDELRRRAAARLRREPSDSTLEPTALVHEVYLRLIDQTQVDWRSRAHFFALAALMMRRVVIDHARRRRYAKRGGGVLTITLDEAPERPAPAAADLLTLDQALTELGGVDPELARLVELRFFGGLTQREIGEVLGCSVPTVTRRWRLARAWLYHFLEEGASGSPSGASSSGGS